MQPRRGDYARMDLPNENSEIIILEPEDFVVVELPEVIDLSFLASKDYREFETAVVRLTNKERTDRGFHSLTRNECLSQSALAQALDMAENRFISHTGSDGSNVAQRATRSGYKNWIAIGENLAMGQRTPGEVIQGWMNSPGHRKNLLNKEFYEIGVAYIEGDIVASNGMLWQGGYWVQNFGTRLDQIGPLIIKWCKNVASSIAKPEDREIEIVILDQGRS